jgi:hypothetical protein
MLYTKRSRAGGLCGFNPCDSTIQATVKQWRDWALDPNIIAPPEANTSYHKFDQTLLVLLLYELESCNGYQLTEDELDISSVRFPTYFRTRNKIAPYIPYAVDPLVRLYYRTYLFFDVYINTIKQRHTV